MERPRDASSKRMMTLICAGQRTSAGRVPAKCSRPSSASRAEIRNIGKITENAARHMIMRDTRARSGFGLGGFVIITLLLMACLPAASAQTVVHLTTTTYGCANPKAASILSNFADPRRADPQWIARMMAEGHCITIPAGSSWEPLSNDAGGETLLVSHGPAGTIGPLWIPTARIALPPAVADAYAAEVPTNGTNRPASSSPSTKSPTPAPARRADTAPGVTPAAPPVPAANPSPAPTAPAAIRPVAPASNVQAQTPSGGGSGWFWVIAGLVVVGFLFHKKKPVKRQPDRTSSASMPSSSGISAVSTRVHLSSRVQVNRGTPPQTSVPDTMSRRRMRLGLEAGSIPQSRSTPSSLSSGFAWHPAGSSPTVAGRVIAGGMVYIGGAAKGVLDGTGCVIDPSLSVALGDAQPPALSYWPAYGQIAPTCRAAYLRWLAAGKSQPDADIGYVFLYFYGLERRLLIDRPAVEECSALVAEVQRLRSIYAAGNHSFDGYSHRLLEAAGILGLLKSDATAEVNVDVEAPAGGMSLALAVAIARKVAAEEPLSFELAAAGLIGLPYEKGLQDNLALRAMRPDFLKLVRLRFEAAYPAGLLLRNRRNARLALEYHPACMGLRVDLAASSRHLTDPIKLDWSKFVEFAGRAAADLAPLGRLLAFHPERRHSLAALASCPPELAGQLGEPARNWLNALSVPVADVAFKELAQHAIAKHPSKWTLREHREVCEALASAGWCMIPDAADGPERLEDDTVVQLIADPPLRSPRFGIAAATALLVAAIARTVGDQGAEVEERWLDKAGERLALQAGDVLRLRARLHWLRRSATNPAKAGRLMKDAGPEDREFAAWSATIATLAAGPPDKPRLIALEAIYDKLEVPRRALYATMHGAVAAETQGAAQPVIIAEGGPSVLHVIPPAPAPDRADLRVDRLRRVRAETEEVAALLADIFAEEEEEAPKPDKSAEEDVFAGLDSEHAAFARRLAERPTWSREEFEATARSAGVMPDGSIEVINEWAFGRFDEAFLEDADPLLVNVALLAPEASSQAAN